MTNRFACSIAALASLASASHGQKTEIRLDGRTPAGGSESLLPAIAAVGSTVYVAWSEHLSQELNGDVYFNRSLDGGAHWLASDVRLDVGSTPGAALSYAPALVATDASVVVAWSDWRHGPAGTIYFNRSLDGGSTWLATDQRLDRARAPTDGGVVVCSLAASNTAVYAAWSQSRHAGFDHDIAINRSLDGGTTWSRGGLQLNHHEPGHAGAPALAAVGSSVYAVWYDRQSGTERNLYFNRSLYEGATWLPVDVRLGNGRAELYPGIAASGGSVYVVWPDSRGDHVSSFFPDVYFNIALGHQPYGAGLAGSGGFVPTLACSGNASIGGGLQVDVQHGRGAASGWLVLGFSGPASLPAFGGTLLVRPPLIRKQFGLDGPKGEPGAGSASIPLSIPYSLSLIGTRVSFQGFVTDPAARGHVAMSAAVETWIL